MKKKVSQRAGWSFVAVFVGLHLLYCALNLRRCLLLHRPPYDENSPLYRAVERPLMALRPFLAGPDLGSYTNRWMTEPQEIEGICLIGVFVVAATVWLLARYGWRKTYLFWGVVLVCSILFCRMMGTMVDRRFYNPLFFPPDYMEVPLRSAGYVLLFQIPAWLLYGGLQKIFRDAAEEEQRRRREPPEER